VLRLNPTRRILHIDMDAFYASVEQRDDPSLKGRPVAVGGDPSGRGVVAAASYEARAFGVRSAIPMSRAVRLCPQLVIVRPAFERYRAVSNTVFEIFRGITPLVEPLSLDEAYLDVTENAWGEPFGMRVAERLKAAIREATGLTASAGVAPNKFLAKIASGWHKPDGLTVIAPERVESFLQGLPIDARGNDHRPVEPNRPRKSVGSENTFARDLLDLADIRRAVDEMARDVAAWLTRKAVFGRTVTLKIRYSDFTTCTRSGSEPRATQNADAIAARALGLLEKTEAGRRPVRLLGVSVHNLQEVEDAAPPAVSWTPGLPFEE
jgi:DNA polymerase-4